MPVSKSFSLGNLTFSFQISWSKSKSKSTSASGVPDANTNPPGPGALGSPGSAKSSVSTKQPIEFLALPAEIRNLIYRQILVSKEPITGADKLMGDEVAVLLNEYKPIIDIDSAILRTCRVVYAEGLHVLYEQNTFHFADAGAIGRFKPRFSSTALPLRSLTTPFGRLALIQSVSLKITTPSSYREGPSRKSIWKDWIFHFFSEEGSMSEFGSTYMVDFPALKKLTLDFTDWKLEADEGIRVAPFVKKLGKFGGVQELVIAGIKHEPTITNLRNGLLKQGGKFYVVN